MHRIAFVFALTSLVLLSSVVDASQRQRRMKPQDVRLQTVRETATELIHRAATYDPHDPDETRADPVPEARLLLARVTRYADPEREEQAFILAAHAVRMTRLLADVDSATKERALPAMLEHDELAQEIAFTWWDGYDEPGATLGVLGDLVEQNTAKSVARAPRLVAALCVVHDKPQPFRVNENVSPPEDPARLFTYFTHARLNRSTARLSPELLAWVVDGVSVEELAWANRRYAGKNNVGTLFFDIAYDLDHFQGGREKKITTMGFNLPNIKEYGGVCADQAHFACQVGRAIGVPSAVASGQGSSVGHAWVGYLRVRGNNAWWDFSEGRYEDYTKVRGSVRDPQRRTRVPDGEAAVRAAAYGLDPEVRHLSTALVEASRVMADYPGGWTDDVAPFNPPKDDDTPVKEQREASLDARLDLLEQAAMLNPAELRAWSEVQRIATLGQLDDGMKNHWAGAAMRMAGTDFMEFAVDFAMPLVESVEDVDTRSAVLGRLFDYCNKDRPGVAAEIMLRNARLYEDEGDNERAYEAYAFVAKEYADTSSLAVNALAKATTMLQTHGHNDMAADLARIAWGKTKQPDFSPEFAGQSNWTRIGRIYASALRAAGKTSDAQNVSRQLSNLMGR